jgi:two-component system response regulator YesN
MYKVAFIADGKTEIITEIDPWGESEHMSGLAAQALKYIRDHSAESISLSDVADSVYVSRWHMSRIIHNEMGTNFRDLVNKVKIEKAIELLQHPEMQICEVAWKVGFDDPAHFTRAFKKVTGMTARDWRRTSGIR